MIIVHHLENSRSQRVLWLLEELGLDYEIRHYPRDPVTMLAPPELRAVHPLGKSPVITDDDAIVAESGAILEYLVERYGAGRMIPAEGSPDRLRYRYWLHYAEGSLMPILLLKLVFRRVASSPMPFIAKPFARGIAAKVGESYIDPQLELHLDYLEAELDKSEWFAGRALTAADVQMSFPVEAALARAGGARPRPKLARFVERVHARRPYKRALERGGPFEILG